MKRLQQWIWGVLGVTAAVALAYGCGSGGGGSSLGGSSGPLNVFVTDDFSIQYSHVLVTLYQINGTTDGTTFQTLYQSSSGQTVDLASLSSAAQLLGTVSVPSTAFTEVQAVFGNEITVTPAGGGTSEMLPVDTTASNISCSSSTSQCTVTLTAPTNAGSGRLSNLVIDFDLSASELVGGKARLAIQPAPPSILNNRKLNAHVPGVVANLNAGVSFTLQGPGNASLTVDLTSSTSISDQTGAATTLSNGQNVIVDGTIDPSTNTIAATSVRVVTPPSSQPAAASDGAIGTIASINTANGTFVLTVTGATGFMPSSSTITVQTSPQTFIHLGPGARTSGASSTTTGASTSTGSTTTTTTTTGSASFIGPGGGGGFQGPPVVMGGAGLSSASVGESVIAAGSFDSTSQTLTANLVVLL